MRKSFHISPGTPYPMGVCKTKNGKINFAAALRTREECGVLLYMPGAGRPVRLPFVNEEKVGNIYCMQVEGLEGEDWEYNFYAGDEVITDPYAGVIYGNERWGASAQPKMKGGCCAHEFAWESDRPLLTPLSESIVYLLHVRGFTKHISSKTEHRGTFSGIIEKIEYLKELGVTAVEVMPAYEFIEMEIPTVRNTTMEEAVLHYMDKPENVETRINYWGYKEGFYFAPKRSYSSCANPAEEFKKMVKRLHRNGLELIMQFYFPPQVKQAHILEVIKFWVLNYHVDGFHLLGAHVPVQLLATEPMLQNTKLFCHDIDCTDIYETGEVPVYKNLAVYNEEFMYAARHFLKSDEGALMPALNMFRDNPVQTGKINSITSYFGFTLADLVSYDRKHNESNGEDNRDGETMNVSWNCGTEGATRKKAVLALRQKQMRNAMTMLFMAQATPMLVSGDEFGFSHEGNNNPYCQDNKINWLNWELINKNKDYHEFVKLLIRLRRDHPVLHLRDGMHMTDYASCGYPDLSWHGEEAWRLTADPLSRFAGVMYCGRYGGCSQGEADDFIYAAYNMHWEDHFLALPGLPAGMEWVIVIDTGEMKTEVPPCTPAGLSGGKAAGSTHVEARSVRILKSRPAGPPKAGKENKKAGKRKNYEEK